MRFSYSASIQTQLVKQGNEREVCFQKNEWKEEEPVFLTLSSPPRLRTQPRLLRSWRRGRSAARVA